MWPLLVACGAQAVLSFEVDGDGPVRFGFPVPIRALESGLRVEPSRGTELQWSLLQSAPGASTERVWVEIAVAGVRGRAKLRLGGDGPTPADSAALCRIEQSVLRDDAGISTTTTCTWRDGTIDRALHRLTLVEQGELRAGEARWSASEGWLERRSRVRIAASAWRSVGLLPARDGSGKAWRRELLEALPRLPRAPGERGRGDYVRGPEGRTVTNLEFDTVLGFLLLALSEEDPGCLLRAWESARHLVDVDLERGSGLPIRHGHDHRSARPELGHVWLEGLLLVGCVFADRELIADALGIARALAAAVRGGPPRQGPQDRLRDEAWPLGQLEAALRFSDLTPLREGAAAVVASMRARWDPQRRVLRYGEGETREGRVVIDRLWQSAGIALPALRRHVARTGDAQARAIADGIEAQLAEILLDGQPGLPLRAAVAATGPFDVLRVQAAAEGFLLLDGISTSLRRRALARAAIRGALARALDVDTDDLATRFSIVARCRWVHR